MESESSLAILKKIMQEYYLLPFKAKEEGKPVAYVSAFAPVEILRAMGVVCVYPESYAVVCSAMGKSQELIRLSKYSIFSQDLCSYFLISNGTEYTNDIPYNGICEPDILIVSNNQCGTLHLWYKLISEKKNIPLFIMDYPGKNENNKIVEEYIVEQYNSLIEFVCESTKRKFDSKKFEKAMEFSRETCYLWEELHQLNKENPIKISVTKFINSLFPIVVARGTKICSDYYSALVNETIQNKDDNSKRKFRILWHGYPFWFLPKRLPDIDTSARIVINDYTLWWALKYKGENSFDTLANTYNTTYLNMELTERTNLVINLVKDYSIDGVIFHSNRSCRRSSSDILPIREKLLKLEIPSVIIESDMADAGSFTSEQISLRLESFTEELKTR